MSAPIRNLMNLSKCRNICLACWHRLRTRRHVHMYNPKLKATIGVTLLAHQTSLDNRLTAPDPATLTHAYLIKNAANTSVDSSSTVLSQVVANIAHSEEEYQQVLESLTELLELQMDMLSHEKSPQMEVLWDKILEARDQLSVVQQTRKDLELLYASVEKLMEASGEVAYQTGSEYAVIRIGEQLYSAQIFITQVKAKSKRVEELFQQLEIQVIERTAKHAEALERKKKAEEKVLIEDSSEDKGDISEPETQEQSQDAESTS